MLRRSRTVAILAQRPSDFVEMKRAGNALADLGYDVVHVFAVNMKRLDAETEAAINELAEITRENPRIRQVVFSTLPAPLIRRRADDDTRCALANTPPGGGSASDSREGNESIEGAASGESNSGVPAQGERSPIPPSATVRGVDESRARIHLFGIERYIPRRAKDAIYWLLGPTVTLVTIARAYRARIKTFGALLRELDVDIVVLPEDIVGLVTPLMIRAANDGGIPSLILPYTIANQEEAFRSLAKHRLYQRKRFGNWLVSLVWREWVMTRGSVSLVRLPASYIVGHALTGTTPPDPWMMNSGYASAIAVENDVMREYYAQAGIEAERMAVVGALYDDVLAHHRDNRDAGRATLRAELGLVDDRPIVLIGGCPNQLLGPVPGFDFSSMEHLVAFLVEAMAPLREHCHVIVRPHPNFAELGELFEAHGVRSTTVDTARLVALSDLYVAFASATIRWSVSCGIPTVNYDVFQYDYDDYKGVPGVTNVSTRDAFADACHALIPGTASYEAAREKSLAESKRWARLDGKSGERIAELIESLCDERNLAADPVAASA